jgi:hypothetical protein
MKKVLIILLLASGCILSTDAGDSKSRKKIVAIPYPEEAKHLKNPLPRTEASMRLGRVKYEVYCAICHGTSGEGEEESAYDFEVDPSSLVTIGVKERSDGELFWATSHGVSNTTMLPWRDILSDDEIWLIVNYIRLLQEKELTIWKVK